MNEGGSLISMAIQGYFSIKDARLRRKRLREQVENAEALEDKVAGVATLEHTYAVPEEPYEDSPTEDIVSGTSQISAGGKACIPCGGSHFSTTSGMLQESLRFAREGGINHPEVIDRISAAEDELNAFERIDGAAEKVVKLPPGEKELMYDMLKASREMRHMLNDIKDVPSLEKTAAKVQEIKVKFRAKAFKMQIEEDTIRG